MPYEHPMDHDTGLSVRDIGTTSAPMRDQLDELKAKIRLGMSKVELGFWGAGKGSAQNPTPGSYGKDSRRAMRELAKVNDIELSTHATPVGIGPISGIDPQRGQYSDEARKSAMDEIKRAIDFASEVTDGGAVVFHAGEFNRPVIEAGLNNGERLDVRSEESNPQFMEHEAAKNKAWFSVVDKRTGQVQQGPIDTSQTFREPVVNHETREVQVYTDADKNAEGKIIDENGEERFPGDPKLRAYTWRDVIAGTKKHNDLVSKQGFDPEFKTYGNYAKEEMSPTEYFQIKQIQNKILGMRGQEAYYQQLSEQSQRELRQIEEAEKQGGIPESEREKIDIIKRRSTELKNHYLEGIAQIRGQEAELTEQIKNLESVEDYALEKTAAGLADLGMYTMEKQKKEEQERGQKFKKDLYVAPENVFPEQYGGHPEELARIIKEGRKAMANKLVQRGWDEGKAKKESESRIKATFDVAHANLWKKYFTGTDKEYWAWYSKQVKKLQDANVLGHIHITDNFGYGDEHIAPGQGNIPIKELVEKFKKSDVDFVVEPGWQGDQNIIESFKEFGSPIYGLSQSNTSDPWNVIDSSYFGKTQPPYFVVGEYAQQMGQNVGKDFSAWSGVPFE